MSNSIGTGLLIPVLVAGLTLGERAALVFGGLAIVALGTVSLVTGEPWTVWTFITSMLLVVATAIVWGMLRVLHYARQQTRAATLSAVAVKEREQTMLEANVKLQAMNASLERTIAQVATLEVPVIPLVQGSLLVPLVGDLDARRIQKLTEGMLQTVHTAHPG